jgi:DNA-3-methyladenine glycosylase
MMNPTCLPADFYARDAVIVARELLGARLVRKLDGKILAGRVVETEAYCGEEDLACHARAGRTARTAVMYGPPGKAYVYFTYGMHWCLNCVTGPEGFPAAVLVRSIFPVLGLAQIAERRAHRKQAEWCNGPGKLAQALSIDGALNNADLSNPDSGLWIEPGTCVKDQDVITAPRVGINRVAEPWRSIPWRFLVTTPAWEVEE